MIYVCYFSLQLFVILCFHILSCSLVKKKMTCATLRTREPSPFRSVSLDSKCSFHQHLHDLTSLHLHEMYVHSASCFSPKVDLKWKEIKDSRAILHRLFFLTCPDRMIVEGSAPSHYRVYIVLAEIRNALLQITTSNLSFSSDMPSSPLCVPDSNKKGSVRLMRFG